MDTKLFNQRRNHLMNGCLERRSLTLRDPSNQQLALNHCGQKSIPNRFDETKQSKSFGASFENDAIGIVHKLTASNYLLSKENSKDSIGRCDTIEKLIFET